MSLEAVQRIIGRAVTDTEFREALKSQPDEVLKDRDVTSEESQALKGMDWESVSSVSLDLDTRVSRMSGLHAAAGCK